MKRVLIEAFFPSIKGCPTTTGVGIAGTIPPALKRALQQAMKNPRVRHKQVDAIKITASIIDVAPPKKEANEGSKTTKD